MGIIRFFKIMRELRRLEKELPQQLQNQREEDCAMTAKEMAALSDEDLFGCALSRTEDVIDAHEEMAQGFQALNRHQKVVFALNCLESEVNNGGLCQFFVNSSRCTAPYISEYLGLVGAAEHKDLFDGFISANGIDLTDLSSFIIHQMRDYEKQTKRYPFDDYDNAFYDLPSLEGPLTTYIRSHIESF